ARGSSGVNGAALANRGALLPQRRSPFFFFLSALERDTGVYATGIEALENFYAFILTVRRTALTKSAMRLIIHQ
ncbi:MAG: hypothetical protein LBF87_00880, partial [Treponema sp.]|nr:hypothetical protein [Treponema sp.]